MTVPDIIIIINHKGMSVRFNVFFKLAAASMFFGVALGGRYGHQGQLTEEGAPLFAKAQLYNATNCNNYDNLALGLFGCSLIASPSIPLKIAAGGFIVGQLLFIAPLYASAIKGKQPVLSKLMPVGGTSMMGAWLALIFA